jgi:hypothetical protein
MDTDNQLYHYTSLSVLHRFLQPEADLWCTYFRHLSDSTEFSAGLKAHHDYFASKEAKVDSSLSSVLKALLNSKSYGPFTFSLSLDGDSYSQWNNYVKWPEGGVSIGFMYPYLERFAADTKTTTLKECLYGSSQGSELRSADEQKDSCEKINLSLQSTYDKAVAEAKRKSSSMISSTNSFAISLAKVLKPLVSDSIRFKHGDYWMEREFRLVRFVNFKESDEVQWVGGKQRIPSNLFGKRHSLKDSIVSVTISPHGNRLFLKEVVEALKTKYNCSFEIKESKIPFCG